MTSWQEDFKLLSKTSPNNRPLDPDGPVGTSFWEELYQTFKARMIAESNDEASK